MEKLKIYFAGSIRGGREDEILYAKLLEILSEFGTVLTEHVCDTNLTEFGEKGLSDLQIWKRDMDWLEESHVLVSEVTCPSLGVGYEISKAEDKGKPVLCLYRKQDGKRLSAMINGSPKVEKVHHYKNLPEAEAVIRAFFKEIHERGVCLEKESENLQGV